MNDPVAVAEMKRLFGSRFEACLCGRTDVLYREAHGDMGPSNGPDADRLTLHDTPEGVACSHGGELWQQPKRCWFLET